MVKRLLAFFLLLSALTNVVKADLYKALFRESVDYFTLESMGWEPIYYLGKNIWLIQNPIKEYGDFLISLVKIKPQDKFKFLESKLPSFAMQGRLSHLTVYFNPRMSYEQVLSFISKKAKIVSFNERWWSVEVLISGERIFEIASSDMIVYIEPTGVPLQLFNDRVRETVRADWSQEFLDLKGSDVIVGVWDGGWVDSSHEDFSERVTLGDNSQINSHATHVAGTIAGSGVRSEPCGGKPRQWRGIAPLTKIVSFDFNDSIIEYPVAISRYNLDIANNSWGIAASEEYESCYLLGYYDELARIFDEFVLENNLVIVFAAGNTRSSSECGVPERGGYDSINPPATGKNVITAGAINSISDSMTSFSSWGPTDDGRVKPDLVAPGCDDDGKGYINSTLPGNCYGGYGWCGTSMAAPTLTGCAAIVIESFKDKYKKSPLPSTIKAVLIHTAKDLGAPGPDYSFGFGRPDVLRAANLIKWGAIVESSLDALKPKEVWEIPVDPNYEFKVTLVWDDYPAAPGAEIALVNDLDLMVISPSGVVYHPFVLNPENPWANAETGENHTDNVEQILVNNPEGGSWQIVVSSHSMPYPPQNFSIACEFLASENCDADRDGFLSLICDGNDCDDNDSLVNLAESENCYDSKDNDCDGKVNDGCENEDVDIDINDEHDELNDKSLGCGC